MSKIANAFRMYLMLRGRNVVPIKELAEKLEVDSRMIKIYKRELVNAGIPIETKLGRGGGYYLKVHGHLPVPLNYREKESLSLAMSFLAQNQFVHYNTVEKIIREYIRIGDVNQDIYLLKYIHNTNEIIEKRQRYFPLIGAAIKDCQKLQISYYALSKNQHTERTVWPLKLFDYLDSTYMAAYCEQAEDIRFFKISRIEQLELLHSYFSKNHLANIDEMLNNSYGVFVGQTIAVDLTIKYPFNEIVKEKIIAKNQQITDIDDKTIRFIATMDGKQEIESWILSMGEHVTVNGSEELKKSIIKRIQAMNKQYDK